MTKDILDTVKKRESKYLAVSLAAKRMKQLMEGERPQIETTLSQEVGKVAMAELELGKLKLVPRKKKGRVIDLAKP